ncbi:unnamed protein product [Ostreobium quekettii]|uniref:GPN-loop GTPase 3 n=1 Tax=Ostreobium quekettii TaxID=121088 RepID=A0A8S1J6R0_9CHLO|nr:unnamed protein product [Ostreobium quekettii]|eukprot:evm.model.scf_231.3 EVM.evm.TU.scf_231.3   scf_231:37656-43134(+)
MKYAQLVLGPAGVGKSTYCERLSQHCEVVGRPIHIVNLDPAAEAFHYPVTLDIRDLVTLEDVMEELNLGPNGGLMYCMEYFEENLHDWLGEELEGYSDDDYLVFDCPGQIELYSHVQVFRTFIDYLKNDGWQVCAVHCLDSHFMTDITKYVAGCFQALAAMVHLAIPHINIITKMDLCENKSSIDEFLIPDSQLLLGELQQRTGPKFLKLNQGIAQVVDEYSMLSFVPLDVTDEESIEVVLTHIDMATQFGEDAEVKVRDFDEKGGADD